MSTPSTPIPSEFREAVLNDPNLADCETLESLHLRLRELSTDLARKDPKSSPFRQMVFENVHPNPVFEPNPFKKDFGIDGQRIVRYYRYAVKDEKHLIAALEYAVEKTPSGPISVPIITNGNENDALASKTARIYIGGFKSVGNIDFLKKNKIRRIVIAANGIGKVFPAFDKMVLQAKDAGIDFCELPWLDATDQNLFEGGEMERALTFIDECFGIVSSAGSGDGGGGEEEGNVVGVADVDDDVSVLVHCAQGKSRSSSVVVAYMMSRGGMEYDESLEIVKKQRMMAQPNPAFEQQLRDWGKSK